MRVFDLGRRLREPAATQLSEADIPDESTLESLLHANPGVILSEPLFVFGRQPAVETGILDLLAVDQWGNIVVVELKRGQSGSGSASEETILSQPQNYAQSLATYGYEALNEIYQAYQADVEAGRWDVGELAVPASELDDAFEHVFGQPLKPADFNTTQRMVIVAETITRRTEQNARYLLEQGLNLQCVEVQRFKRSDSEQMVLATTVPVDYELGRVQPERDGVPLYPEIVGKILDGAFSDLRPLVHAETPREIATDLNEHDPYIVSNDPDQPEGVRYSIRLHPLTEGVVRIAIDIVGNERALESIRDSTIQFQREGFDVNQTRGSYRIVTDEWDANTVEPLHDDGFLEEIGSRYVELVELGHEVLASESR